ncbi:MAG: YihY family inner membrane protein [Mariprofundaceae bacterium]|nr:YihY family inner membrane protein [Mariprofundaceae bacterium]
MNQRLKQQFNIHYLFLFIQRIYTKFMHDHCLQRASSLAYATLLAIVPLTVLAFSIFASFQDFDHLAQRIQDSLVNYLVPTSQHMVLGYLNSLSGKSTSLSVFGILGLLITITALLTTMEEAFNDIWRLQTKRSHLSRFITFWSLITLSPLLLGLSISITSYFAALPIIHDVSNQTSMFHHIPFLIPWVISSLAMTTLYIALPNTSVRLRHAMVAACVAGAFFEAGKLGFAFYITKFADYEKLYGTLGTLPVFLLWIYITWVIILMGAEINVCLQQAKTSDGDKKTTSSQQLVYFHHILYQAALAFQSGTSIQAADIAKHLHVDESNIMPYFKLLQQHHLLQCISVDDNPSSHWQLGMDAQKITWQMIHDIVYPQSLTLPKDTILPWHLSLKQTYQRLAEQQQKQLSQIKLADFIENT